MKHLSYTLGIVMMAMFMTVGQVSTYAQNEKEEIRKVKNEQKESRRALNKRSSRDARKEARKLTKEGWKTMSLPIDKQLDITWERINLLDAVTGLPKYIYAVSQANGQSFSAAQMQAENTARIRIAENIASSVAALTDIAMANSEITPQESASVQEVVQNAKVLVGQKLGRMITSECIYKQDKAQYTVRVVVLYDLAQAVNVTKKVVQDELRDKLNDNGAMLNKIIGLDKFADTYTENFDEEL